MMNRQEQFEELENTFTYEPDLNHFEIAFMAHYKLLDKLIDNAAEEMKKGIRNLAPRVAYAEYYESVCLIYSQLCIVFECMCKMLLAKHGYGEFAIKKLGHNLIALLDELDKINDKQVNRIFKIMSNHTKVLKFLADNNVFVDVRYMETNVDVSVKHINIVKALIVDIDLIYSDLYSNFDLEQNVYPSTM